jgi:hypothetical protein
MILLPILIVYIQYWIAHNKSRDSMQSEDLVEPPDEN